MADDHNDKTTPADGGYEKHDVAVGKLILGTAAITIFIAAFVIVLFQFFTLESEDQVYNAVLAPESATLLDMRAHEDEVLNSYAVVDSTKGICRIPIEHAMKLVADEAFQEKAAHEGGK